ncbi:apotyrosinase chaperone MelC1 [Streptomyces sp. enrichment culture]|uniref:apotyrosinase chaperone MelC1 n=1 Tax=Streptomyces sp. enrichment culture TaxID=1795815 RepID=UPI003F572F89
MPELTRRRALAAGAAVAATGATLAAGPGGGASAADDGHHRHGDHGHGHGSPQPFDEVYKGRRIQGRPTGAARTGGTGSGGHHHGTGYAVFVDGVELHLMRNADGTWISVVSHYDPVPTPKAAARAAVDELQGARLLPFPAN